MANSIWDNPFDYAGNWLAGKIIGQNPETGEIPSQTMTYDNMGNLVPMEGQEIFQPEPTVTSAPTPFITPDIEPIAPINQPNLSTTAESTNVNVNNQMDTIKAPENQFYTKDFNLPDETFDTDIRMSDTPMPEFGSYTGYTSGGYGVQGPGASGPPAETVVTEAPATSMPAPRNFLQKAMDNFSFGNIGSAKFDKNPFLKEGGEFMLNEEGDPIANPDYGEMTDEGKGLFGKEGGFMSKFGTGEGIMSDLGGALGSGLGEGLLSMSQSLMGPGFQYDNPYSTRRR